MHEPKTVLLAVGTDLLWVFVGVVLIATGTVTPDRLASISLLPPDWPVGAWLLTGVVLAAGTFVSVISNTESTAPWMS